jgi:flagellar assembly protein FliH
MTVRPWRAVAGVRAGESAAADQSPAGGEAATSAGTPDRLIQVCRSLAAALEREREGLLEALEPHLVALVFGAAEAVVQREARADQALVERTVARALAAASQATTIAVHVSPAQVTQVEQVFAGADARVRVLADESITGGGCTLETDWGDIDATLEMQLGRLREALAEAGPRAG